jgi:OmpA-OmpF porin, OOP family
MKKILALTGILFAMGAIAQNDNVNGDWKQRYVLKKNTQEAEYMIRTGDIDNLGFGFVKGYNPFSGKSTDPHQYPTERTDATEPLGYDLVMLGSSFTDDGNGRDGYSAAREYLMTNFGKTNFELKVPMSGVDTSKIKNVTLQLFVDDFQAKEFGSKFEFYLNGTHYAGAERVLNALRQTGPIGKLITLNIPPERLKDFKRDTVRMLIDDKTTGLGDGYAIDFVKVLINPITISTGTVSGVVIAANGTPVMDAVVSCGKIVSAKTKKDGKFVLTGVPTGHAMLVVQAPGKKEEDFTVDVEADTVNKAELRFE